MEKDYYTFQEILFGLREEYLKNQQLLYQLNCMLSYDKTKISSVQFTTIVEEDKRVRLIAVIKKRQNSIANVLQAVAGRLSSENYKECIIQNGTSATFDTSLIAIPNHIQPKFISIAKIILESDFAKEPGRIINVDTILPQYSLTTTPRGISLNITNGSNVYQASALDYFPETDELNVQFYKSLPSKSVLLRNLNLPFPKAGFSPCQRKWIETSSSKTKQVIMPTPVYGNATHCFQIQETDTNMILKKVLK